MKQWLISLGWGLIVAGMAAVSLPAVAESNRQIPGHIVIRRAGPIKSCAEIAGFISSTVPSSSDLSSRDLSAIDSSSIDSAQTLSNDRFELQELNCAAARNIPAGSSLELLKSSWNARLQRREFALRCARPQDCVPFLVWEAVPKRASAAGVDQSFSGRASSGPAPQGPTARMERQLVKSGQTAMLTWEQGGIRVILPVTCLEAGGLGQYVRVRFKNAARTLRAEIVGAGAVRVSL